MQIEKEIYYIDINLIIPNRFQPRLSFDNESLRELAESIKQHGIIQPLVLRKLNDKFEIIAGERRFKAATMLGMPKVPAIIMNANDYESAEVALIENIQRQQLSVLEEAKSYKKLLDKGYINQEELAKKLGKAQSTIANRLRLLNLNESVQQALLNNQISERHARSLLSIKDSDKQTLMLANIINKKLTVRQTDDAIKKLLGGNYTNEFMLDVSDVNKNVFDTKEEKIEIENKETIDINKMVMEAMDINHDEIVADTNLILKGEGIDPNQIYEKNINNMSETSNKIPSDLQKSMYLEDEEANMSMGDGSNIYNYRPDMNIKKEEVKEVEVEEKKEEEVNESFDIENINKNQMKATYVTSDIRTAINTIRNGVATLEKYGFIVDSEEFDFENMYQIILKINKGRKNT